MKKLVLLLALFALPAVAEETIGAEPASLVSAGAEASQAAKVQSFIQKLGDQVVAILGDKSLDEAGRNEKLRRVMRDTFDLPTIGKFVLGRSWQTATPDQQKEYMRLFDKLVISIYSERFALYSGEKMTAKTSTPQGKRDFLVISEIANPKNPNKPVKVDWRVRDFGSRLGVIDVVVEGVSMSVTQRQEYQSVIQRNAGAIQPLLDLMKNRLEGKATD
ncbi:MAG: ABC transporter substrate-binding protein [Alphaproteobacteria bacterium]|nr:ABC transporter substrate-binding protein [Alphaproteobacteria bacterium]